ncbi:MAG: hypothetical protein RLZ12_942 [Bacillota bacterium]
MLSKELLKILNSVLAALKLDLADCTEQERDKWKIYWQACIKYMEGEQLQKKEATKLAGNKIEEISLSVLEFNKFRSGMGYLTLGLWPQAAEQLRDLLHRNPGFYLGRIYLALALFYQVKYLEAKKELNFLLSTKFEPVAYHLLGCIALNEKNYSQAKACFSKELQLVRVPSKEALFNLALSHYILNEYNEADKYFRLVLQKEAGCFETMNFLAEIARLQAKWEGVKRWRKAAYDRQFSLQIIEQLAYDYEEMGNFEQAYYWYRFLLDLDVNNLKAYHGLIWTLVQLNQIDMAKEWLRKARDIHGNVPRLRFLSAWIMLLTGELSIAERFIMQGLQEEERPIWLALESRLWSMKGYVNFGLQLDKCEHNFLRAFARYQAGWQALNAYSLDEAILNFRQANVLMPLWRDPLHLEGAVHLINGDLLLSNQCFQAIGFNSKHIT